MSYKGEKKRVETDHPSPPIHPPTQRCKSWKEGRKELQEFRFNQLLRAPEVAQEEMFFNVGFVFLISSWVPSVID